jgi:hypothetical protein
MTMLSARTFPLLFLMLTQVSAQCFLCPDGKFVEDGDQLATIGLTCGEAEAVITNNSTCTDLDDTNQAYAARCCAGNLEFPFCEFQQNPFKCTEVLLNSTTEECECYTFCDDLFVSCSTWPGEIIQSGEIDCKEKHIVSGCSANLAALYDEGNDGTGGGEGAFATDPPEDAATYGKVSMIASMVGLAVAAWV